MRSKRLIARTRRHGPATIGWPKPLCVLVKSIMKAFRRKARRGERSQRMDIKAIRQRPAAATYWEGCFWGYPREARTKNAGILNVFSPISVPSRGVSKYQ